MSFKIQSWCFKSTNGDEILIERDLEKQQFTICPVDYPDQHTLFEIDDIPQLMSLLTELLNNER